MSRERPRILLLVHGLPVGGTEMLVASLARFLVTRGMAVEIGCLDLLGDLGESLAREGFSVTWYRRQPGLDVRVAWRIASHVRRSKVDLIHAHQYTPYFYGVLAKLAARVPLVFTEHGRFDPDLPSPRRRIFNRIFWRLADRATAVSESVRRSLVTVEGFPADAIRVVRNGIDVDRFARGAVDAPEAKERLGIPRDACVLGTVGRLDPIKNQSALLRALARLHDELDDLRLVLVGDGPERTPLEVLAARLGLSERTLFLGERHDVERILPAFDVFALPSRGEGIPVTLLEAMAASRPIVASAVGGIPEILDDGREARLVPVPEGDDRDAPFLDAIRKLLRDDGGRRSLGARAAERVRRDFSAEAMLSAYESIYRELL